MPMPLTLWVSTQFELVVSACRLHLLYLYLIARVCGARCVLFTHRTFDCFSQEIAVSTVQRDDVNQASALFDMFMWTVD